MGLCLRDLPARCAAVVVELETHFGSTNGQMVRAESLDLKVNQKLNAAALPRAVKMGLPDY